MMIHFKIYISKTFTGAHSCILFAALFQSCLLHPLLFLTSKLFLFRSFCTLTRKFFMVWHNPKASAGSICCFLYTRNQICYALCAWKVSLVFMFSFECCVSWLIAGFLFPGLACCFVNMIRCCCHPWGLFPFLCSHVWTVGRTWSNIFARNDLHFKYNYTVQLKIGNLLPYEKLGNLYLTSSKLRV